MKVLKESLLLNDLNTTLDVATQEEVLIMRNDKEAMVVMTLENYNKLKEEVYKSKK